MELQTKKTELEKKKEMYASHIQLLKNKQDAIRDKINILENSWLNVLFYNTYQLKLANLYLELFELEITIASKQQYMDFYALRDLNFKQYISKDIQAVNEKFGDLIFVVARPLAYQKGVPKEKRDAMMAIFTNYQNGYNGEYGDYKKIEDFKKLSAMAEDLKEYLGNGQER